MPHGRLAVVVEGATDLNTPGGGSHPVFNTLFEFEIDRTTNELHVCVYSEDCTSRDDELVGFCTLSFKIVFSHGHTVPITAYPIQQASGNPGGKVNISFEFSSRPSPNEHNTHAPSCGLSVDRSYDCPEDASEANHQRRTSSDLHGYHENYLNLHASDNHHKTKPSFKGYGASPKLLEDGYGQKTNLEANWPIMLPGRTLKTASGARGGNKIPEPSSQTQGSSVKASASGTSNCLLHYH